MATTPFYVYEILVSVAVRFPYLFNSFVCGNTQCIVRALMEYICNNGSNKCTHVY
jgi:hypothetical protein